MTPINDLHGPDAPALAKGERLMRCKVSSIHRLLDLYGWAQLGDASVTVSAHLPVQNTPLFIIVFNFISLCFFLFPVQLRVSKEQEHFLVAPQGLACSEVTAASLVSVSPAPRGGVQGGDRDVTGSEPPYPHCRSR